MRSAIRFALLGILCFGMAGCGLGGSRGSVKISPNPASLTTGQEQTFSVTVMGCRGTKVLWSVDETEGGSITDAGVYTAPDTPGTYHVTAECDSDRTIRDTVPITVN